MRKRVIKKANNQVDKWLNLSDRKSVEEMTLLELIGCVMGAFENEEEDTECGNIQSALAVLAKRFGITERQAVLFSACVSEGPSQVCIEDLAETLGVNSIKMLSLSSDINALVDRQLLCYYNAANEEGLFVPSPVVKALKSNEVYVMPSRKGLSGFELFELIRTWFSELGRDFKTYAQTVEDLRNLFKDNTQVKFARKMAKMGLDDDELLLLSYFCSRLVSYDDNKIRICELENLFETCRYTRNAVLLQQGTHPLLDKKLIENVCMDGIASKSWFQLTDNAKNDLLSEVIVMTQQADKQANVIEAETLIAKELYYTKGNAHQVEELGTFFEVENYRQIRERMCQRGFRSGFACLFYGGPGTGKTETAYQLARQTGRNIMIVDVPQVKSKWVGDSEKNIKAIFDQYRRLVNNSTIAPILLFNEADAILSTRMNGAEHAVDKMENSIQNIILQEMENLDGILIATTNLEGNMDAAFERRFLYKIHFEKPDAGVRAKIWRQMIPELTEQDAAQLAANYDFSGGQIENIARKHAIHVILHGSDDGMHHLLDFCANERLVPNAYRRIGF